MNKEGISGGCANSTTGRRICTRKRNARSSCRWREATLFVIRHHHHSTTTPTHTNATRRPAILWLHNAYIRTHTHASGCTWHNQNLMLNALTLIYVKVISPAHSYTCVHIPQNCTRWNNSTSVPELSIRFDCEHSRVWICVHPLLPSDYDTLWHLEPMVWAASFCVEPGILWEKNTLRRTRNIQQSQLCIYEAFIYTGMHGICICWSCHTPPQRIR